MATIEDGLRELYTKKEADEESVKKLNGEIWRERYLKSAYSQAISSADILKELAEKKGLSGNEALAWCDCTVSWAQYRSDRNNKQKNNRSWKRAKEALVLARDPFLRSLLFEVAGLCQIYLVDEQDEKAEPLIRQGVEDAEKSGQQGRIGEAKNGFGLWLMALGRWKEAMAEFVEVDEIQEAAGEDRLCGNANNNLIRCFLRLAEKSEKIWHGEAAIQYCLDGLARADRAIEKYHDAPIDHTMSARFRKTEVLRLLGKLTKERRYFEEAITIYRENKARWPKVLEGQSSETVEKKLSQEEENIKSTEKEMEGLA